MKRTLTFFTLLTLLASACQSTPTEELPDVGNTVTAPVLEAEPL